MSIFSSMRYCLGPSSSYTNLWAALAFMPFGLFFDFMDGKVARWRKKSSLMGQELDSLADLVCSLDFDLRIKLNSKYRSPSASLPQQLHLPSASVHLSIMSSSHSSSSVDSPALHVSISLLPMCLRMQLERVNTLKERRSPLRCRLRH